MLLRLIQYKSYDSYSRSELQGQLGRPLAVHCLYYNTDSFLCQVKIVLNCFVYFMQCFVTIFAQHLTAIFLHVLRSIYNRKKLPAKMQFRRSKPLSCKVFCDHFSCALLHAEHNLTQLYHTIHLAFCQVKIVLIISMYFLQNTAIKHFTHHLFSTNISVCSLHIIFA